MSDQLEDLIREIATKHGIAVARDDPILVLQTINNRLMQESSKAQQDLLDRYKEELEALALRWGDDAKLKAERILNAAVSAGKEEIQGIMEKSAASAALAISREMEAALERTLGEIRSAGRMSLFNMLAAVVTLAAATTAYWAATHQI